jgi:hypothetical protein
MNEIHQIVPFIAFIYANITEIQLACRSIIYNIDWIILCIARVVEK